MPDDLLDKQGTAFVSIDASKYQAEQELADRYRAFVSEILRLALAGLAVFSLIYKNGLPPDKLAMVDIFALLGIALFALSAVSALVFLYCASEGLRWYIAGLRYATVLENSEPMRNDQVADNTNVTVNDYLAERMKWIVYCRWSKLLDTILLGSGGVLVAISIIF